MDIREIAKRKMAELLCTGMPRGAALIKVSQLIKQQMADESLAMRIARDTARKVA